MAPVMQSVLSWAVLLSPALGLVLREPSTPTIQAANGITTPTPTQPGLVDNCDAFYLVHDEDGCASVAQKNGLSLRLLFEWNTGVDGATCKGLVHNAYACVSVVGHTYTPKETPVPIQDGMVGTCKAFHYVLKGQTCATVASQYGISVSSFMEWNPAVGDDCRNLWTDSYACVGL